MKASQIIASAQSTLQDQGVYWPEAELLAALNEGRRRLCELRPDIYAETDDLVLVAGTRQALPNRSQALFHVARNVSHRNQRAVTIVGADILARLRPAWRSMRAGTEIQHYLYDERTPGEFEVYPPAQADTVVEIRYANPPADVTSTSELLAEGNVAPVLIDYVLYRAFLKESDASPQALQRAVLHNQAFEAAATGGAAPKLSVSPNRGTPGPQAS